MILEMIRFGTCSLSVILTVVYQFTANPVKGNNVVSHRCHIEWNPR